MATPSGKTATSRAKSTLIIFVLLAIAVPAAGFVAYTYVTLNWAYSEGERSGVLQKFSSKGWVCKTGEGELSMSLVPGSTPTIWDFTVREASLASRLNNALGHRVVVHYREHPGVPTNCFGDTHYYVDDVRIIE